MAGKTGYASIFMLNHLPMPEMEKPSLPLHPTKPGRTHRTLTVDKSDCKSFKVLTRIEDQLLVA